MNPDPLTVIEDDPEPPHRDARLVVLAFAGIGVLALLAWITQGAAS